MIKHETANRTIVIIAVMLMVFCIGGWLTGLATVTDTSIKNDPKVDARIIDSFEGEELVEVVVILREPGQGLRSAQIESMQTEILDAFPNIEVTQQYSQISGFSGELDKETLNLLRFNENVEKIYLNEILRLDLDESVALIDGDYVYGTQLKNTFLRGRDQSVCVLDAGVDYNHAALAGRVVSGWDFYNNDSDAIDDNGHGTHVAGIIASNDATYTGVAPEASVVAVKVCDSTGLVCPSSDVLAGIDWCINNSDTYNISVISMSLGSSEGYNSSTCPTSFDSAADNSIENDIFIVASSGNSYHNNGISLPACSPNITSVNAVDKQDSIWDRGNTGDLLDLLAPGVSIISSKLGGGFESKTGTSMAAPHVAGAALLLYQSANLSEDNIEPEQIREELKSTGLNMTDSDNGLNFSRINIKEAVLISELEIGDLATPYPRTDYYIRFYANYTNKTNNAVISDGDCLFEINGSSYAMTYNSSEELYIYSRNFTNTGIYSYNVTCNQSNFENLRESANIEVVQGSDNCTYPGSNIDWNITSNNGSWCVGEDLIINQSNINIEAGAEFVLNDTNITLVGASSHYLINVSENSNFNLKNVVIKGMDQSTRRLDIDISGQGDFYNTTFENSVLTIRGNETHEIEGCEFKYRISATENSVNNILDSTFEEYAYLYDSSNNNIENSTFNSRIYIGQIGTTDNSYNEIENSSFYGDLVILAANAVINFTTQSEINSSLMIQNTPIIDGVVDMPSSTTMNSNNLTRYYPIYVYHNGTTDPYENREVNLTNNGSLLWQGDTDSNGFVGINITLNTTNYGIGNFTVMTNDSQDLGLLSDTPISLEATSSTPAPPASSGDGGSSGGGGGGSSGGCVENWTCTDWTSCMNGYEYRTCIDENNCGTEINKPNNTQECVTDLEQMPKLVDGSGGATGSGGGSDSEKDPALGLHGDSEEDLMNKSCCLWRICGGKWLGLCWYTWTLIGGIIILLLTIWVLKEHRKRKHKRRQRLMKALGVDWTLKHLHLK